MKKKILLTAGGTGGHMFPALALADDLKKEFDCEVMFAAGKLSENSFFDHTYPFEDIDCGQLKLAPWSILKETIHLAKGVKQSCRLIKEFDPDLVIGFGSYYTVPVLIAAKLLKKPVFLHEQNSMPGRVNRIFAPFVEKTFVHFPSALSKLKGNGAVGGMPLRRIVRKGDVSKELARESFQLSKTQTTLLVFGGSQGAKKINHLFSEATLFHLKEMLPRFQVIHFTGSHEEAEKMMGRYVCANIAAYVRPFEQKMGLAWSSADLAVTRAGAASIAEQVEFEVPGILIPYPHSTDNHQDLNADYLVTMGLGKKIQEAELTPQRLASAIQEIFFQIPERMNLFKEYKTSEKKIDLAGEIITWLTQNTKKI